MVSCRSSGQRSVEISGASSAPTSANLDAHRTLRVATVKMITRNAKLPGIGSTPVANWATPVTAARSSMRSGARRRSAITRLSAREIGTVAICPAVVSTSPAASLVSAGAWMLATSQAVDIISTRTAHRLSTHRGWRRTKS